MPRYEFSEGTSNKFWQIDLNGTSFTTTYGKIGTAGQTTLKSFKDEATARKEHDKIVAEKVKKGYRLVEGGAAPQPAAAAPAKAGKETPEGLYRNALETVPKDFKAGVALLKKAEKAGYDVGGELVEHCIELFEAGKTEEDLVLCRALTEALPRGGEGWYHYGLSLVKGGKYPESIAATTEAIKLMPDYANAYYSRSCAYALSGQKDKALADVARALEIDPGLRGDIACDGDYTSIAMDPAFRKLVAPPEKAPAEDGEDEGGDEEAEEGGKVRYEFKDGASNKFWEIELDGSSFTTTWGRIGSAGQTATKDFEDEAEAERQYEVLVAEKVKKGYQLVSGRPAGAPPEFKSNPELEKAVLANPDDAQAYLVYADWLQGQGDPRGELMALQHAMATDPAKKASAQAAEKKLLEKNKAALLGPIAKNADCFPTVEWRYGFLRKVKVGLDYEMYEDGLRLEKLLKQLLAHPSARFLEELVLGPESFEGDLNYQACIDLLVKHGGPKTLRSLFFGDFTYEDCEVSWSHLGNLSKLYAAFPRLRSLTIHTGSRTLGKIVLPELREFRLQTGGLDRQAIQDICNAKWPRLERLEIWFGNHSYGAEGTVKDLEPILAAQGLPNLKHLGLMNAEFTDDIAVALAGSKVLAQLETLDLTMGCLSGEGVRAILSSRDAFKHLKKLDVSNNAVDGGQDEKLKGICPEVVTGKQSPDRIQEDYRYTAVGE